MLVGVVAAVPLSAQQSQHLDRVHSPRGHCHRIAIGRKQPVLGTQGQDRADLARFLPMRRRVHRQPPLLGQRGGLDVDLAAEHHAAVQLTEHLGRRE